MGAKITPPQASEKAWEIINALKGGSGREETVDASFTLYLTELITSRGTMEEPALSRELVNDVIAAMMKHGVNMHDWPLIIDHLLKSLHMVILYNIPEVYQEKAVELAAEDLRKRFGATRQEYLALMGVE